MMTMRRTLPFLFLPLAITVVACGSLPPAAATPSPVAEATPEATAEPSREPAASPEPSIAPEPRTLAERRAAWEAAGIDDYTWRIRRECFCGPIEPIDVRVEDGIAIDVVTAGGDRVTDTEGLILTVDDLFAAMRRARREGGDITAEYGQYGQPRSVVLDYVPNGDDDETYFETRRFTPAP